jgi:hypothetical protein
MSVELQTYAPDRKAALDEKLVAIRSFGDPQRDSWVKYQTAINEGTADAALETINQAPAEMKESLYQQLASRVSGSGDSQRARQIITERITNPIQRQQALRNLDQQSVRNAIGKGKIDEALRLLNNLRPNERAVTISEVVTRIGPGVKRASALNYLEQVRGMLDPSPKASDQIQMYALLQLARAFARYDPARALEIIDPLIDQFNELSASALVLNGFGQKYYVEGELIMNNGNAIGEAASRLAPAIAGLAMANFDRAKASAERLRPIEVRLSVYLAIAQRATQDTRGGVVDY